MTEENAKLQAKVKFYVDQTIDQFKQIKMLRNQKRVLLDLLPTETRKQLINLGNIKDEPDYATCPPQPAPGEGFGACAPDPTKPGAV